MEGHMHKHIAIKLLVFGAVLILVRLYTEWDIWVVIGTLLILKALIMFFHPGCCKEKKK